MKSTIKFTGIQNPYEVGKYGVAENAKKLLRYAYIHQELMFVQCAQLPSLQDWELKQGISRHLYEDAEAATALRERIVDMRTSAALLGKAPDPFVQLFFEELIHAKSDLELAAVLYGFVKPKLLDIYRKHVKETQQIVDQPTIRMFRQIIADLEEQVVWGADILEHLQSKETADRDVQGFVDFLKQLEQLGGGFDAEGEKSKTYPDKQRSAKPYTMVTNIVRDSTMGPAVNQRASMGIAFENPDEQLLVDMMRVRQEEMVACELIASVIYLQKNMPWEFYHDLARHLWDEARHCMFGQAALEAANYDWRSRPQFAGDYDLIVPKMVEMRYAWLSIGIEDAQMKRPGKVAEFEFCKHTAKHPLMTQFQDYDWADEVNHAAFGRKWTPEMFDEDLETIRDITVGPVKEYFTQTGLSLKQIVFK